MLNFWSSVTNMMKDENKSNAGDHCRTRNQSKEPYIKDWKSEKSYVSNMIKIMVMPMFSRRLGTYPNTHA